MLLVDKGGTKETFANETFANVYCRIITTSGYTLKTTKKRGTPKILIEKRVRAETFSGESRLPMMVMVFL